MSAGPIPDYYYRSGVAPQADGHNPVYINNPQRANQQQQQQNDEQIIQQFLSELPEPARAIILSINPGTLQMAYSELNRLADEALRYQRPI